MRDIISDLYEELEELTIKLYRLNLVIACKDVRDTTINFDLLMKQANIMKAYRSVLNERIDKILENAEHGVYNNAGGVD